MRVDQVVGCVNSGFHGGWLNPNVENAGPHQGALQTRLGRLCIGAVDGAGATQFGRQGTDILAVCGGGGIAAGLRPLEPQTVRKPEPVHHVLLQGFVRIVVVLGGEDGRDIEQRTAAGMQVEQEIGLFQQRVFDIVGDHLGRGTGRVAGKCPVEVAVVDRRGSQSCQGGREVRHRQQNNTAADLCRLQLADHRRQDYLSLVFVPMIARHQQHRRAGPVGDTGDRDRKMSIGGPVHRMRQAKVTGLLSGGG